MPPPTTHQHVRGFTLIEVLVALVITSLLVSILMGLLFYVYRVQDSLRGEIVEREFSLRTKAWFSDTLAACVPAESGSGNEFIGADKTVTCDTLAPLRPQSNTQATQRITFSLKNDIYRGNELIYREDQNKDSQTTVIARLPDGEASFTYTDTKGEQFASWPPAKNQLETLPNRIELTVKQSSELKFLWLATPRADPWLAPTIKNPFGLELPK